MNIFNYFKKVGINTIDPSFYRKIEEWKSWYVGNVRGFTRYKIYSGRGQGTYRKRKTLGMAKKVCEDLADLLMNEKVQITLSEEREDAFVKRVLSENKFARKSNEYQERKAATGTAAYVVYLDEAEVDAEGYVQSGKIKINYLDAGAIYPVSWENGEVKECVFVTTETYLGKKYAKIQSHMLSDGRYKIENTILECITGSAEGRELAEAEWRALKPFQNMAKVVETVSDKPQFVIDTLNIVNNANNDESNPMGVALYANAIDVLKSIDIAYDSYSNEFELGKKRIFAAPEMLKDVHGNQVFDPDDTVFYMLPEEYAGQGGKAIEEVNPNLRIEEHSKAINDNLNYLSMKCGFGTNRYKFENGQVKTATEVISENSDMYRTIKKNELVLDPALEALIRIILRLGNITGESLKEDVEVQIQFDDSIIEDAESERKRDREDVSMGAMQLWEYRAKWYGEDEETAKAAVGIQEEVIE